MWYTVVYMVRMRSTKGARNSRRSHHGLAVPEHTQESEGPSLRHHISRITGRYRGKEIINVSKRNERLQRNAKKEESTDEEKKTVEHVPAPPEN